MVKCYIFEGVFSFGSSFTLQLVKATEWLGFVDILSKEVMHSQNYTLMPYTMYLPVTFHLLFASNAPHKVQYPHSQFEVSVTFYCNVHPLGKVYRLSL